MKYDVYLGGLSKPEWRTRFKKEISNGVKIFDPLAETLDNTDKSQIYDQAAKQLYYLENGNIIVVFYLNEEWNGSTSLLEIGDSVGRGKQVIVCLDGNVRDADKIRCYCEFRGALVVNSLEELISVVESCLTEVKLCSCSLENMEACI